MDVHGLLGDHRYRLIAFDWDGTAVTDRKEHPAELARAMQRLLDAGSLLVVITGTNADNVGGQIAPLLTPAALSRLYMMVNRGSEVYAHEADGTRFGPPAAKAAAGGGARPSETGSPPTTGSRSTSSETA